MKQLRIWLSSLAAMCLAVVAVLTPLSAQAYSILNTVHTDANPQGVAISPDDANVWVPNYNAHNVQVFDAKSLALKATISLETDNPTDVVVAPNGETAYVSTGDVAFWTISTSTYIATRHLVSASFPSAGAQTLTVSPNGSTLYIPDPGSNVVYVIDTSSNIMVTRITTSPIATGEVLISPDGSTGLILGNDWGNLTISGIAFFDPTNNAMLGSITGIHTASGAISPDSQKVYVVDSANSYNTIDIPNRHIDMTQSLIPNYFVCNTIAVTPDGLHLWAQNQATGGFNVFKTSDLLPTDELIPNPIPNPVYQAGIVINHAGNRAYAVYTGDITNPENDRLVEAEIVHIPEPLPDTGANTGAPNDETLPLVAMGALTVGIALLIAGRKRLGA